MEYTTIENINMDLVNTIAINIADAILNFDDSYQQYDGQTLEEYMEEFNIGWLESTNEWIVVFGDELLFDNIEDEKNAYNIYYLLENKAYSIVNDSK